MKKYFLLLLLIFSVQLFAKEKPTVSSLEITYILDGDINEKYPITMYLTVDSDYKKNTCTITGKYYYNNIGDFIYLDESVLSKWGNITLKEYPTSSDAFIKENSTGEFTGYFSNNAVFKGIWKNKKNSFEYELKPRNIVVEIKKYTFKEERSENAIFESDAEILQIISSKKTSSIKKINKELNALADFSDLYSYWGEEYIKEDPDSPLNHWTIESRSHLEYIDNNILSVGYFEMSFTGGTGRMNVHYSASVYSLSSGKKLTVDDLILNVDDNKLIALMREQLKEYMIMTEGSDTIPNEFYTSFENIRLGDRYSVNDTGVTFLYDKSEISRNTPEPIEVHFTYDELKPFVKKSSPMWYLFE